MHKHYGPFRQTLHRKSRIDPVDGAQMVGEDDGNLESSMERSCRSPHFLGGRVMTCFGSQTDVAEGDTTTRLVEQ